MNYPAILALISDLYSQVGQLTAENAQLREALEGQGEDSSSTS